MAIDPARKKSQRDEDIVAEILRDHSENAGSRGNFEDQWQEIAQRVIPSHSDLFFMNGAQRSKGSKHTEELYDSTAAIALTRFSAILDSLLTPRNQTWHRLMANDPNLNKDREVRLWFDEVNRILFKYRYAPRANFASQNQMDYKSLGAYGTAGMFIDKLAGEKGLRYKSISLGELFIAENHQGMVDKALRYFSLTARQAVQQWGAEKMPASIMSAMERSPETEFFFIHCVKPRADRDPQRIDYAGMEYGSYYVSVEGKVLLEEGGYNTFPYAISRYEQAPGEVYGRSPAMDVLPAIKTLNEEKKTMLKQGHRAVDPVLLAFDDGVISGFSMRPGAINAGGVSANGQPLIHALPVGNVAIGKDMMDDERVVINDAFLVRLFQILTESPQMTATEVLERTREKGMILAPTLGRQQSERLGPMIDRELDVLSSQRLLPPMPRLLLEAGADYRAEYDSPLSRAQRAEEAAGLMRTVETTLSIVNVTQNPEPLDYFDWDVIIPSISEIQGVPTKWMRADKYVQQMRQDRAQAAQQKQMVDAAPGAAAMMKANAVAQQKGPVT